jgi:hypothetical protein
VREWLETILNMSESDQINLFLDKVKEGSMFPIDSHFVRPEVLGPEAEALVSNLEKSQFVCSLAFSLHCT